MKRLSNVLHNRQAEVPPAKPASANVIAAVQAAVAADNDQAIKALQKELDKANNDCKTLRAEIAVLQNNLKAARAATETEVAKVRTESRAAYDRLCTVHKGELQTIKEELKTTERKLATECQLRVKAESDCAAETKLRAGADKLLNTLQTFKKAEPVQMPAQQVIMPQAQPMKPLTMTVSQRDSSGRIAALTITPST